MAVLVTGGAGYIGTHILCALAQAGRQCVSIDNYCNSSPAAIERAGKIAPGAIAYDVDIRDAAGLKKVLDAHEFDSVIHLAGLKAVGESVAFPKRYYDNNVRGTESLLAALIDSPVRKFVFSSSATVYGRAERMPIPESTATTPQSPYGENKLEIERMLTELSSRDPSWRVANLRYFNPVGAHPSGLIGEDPTGIPNNLMPFVCQVASGALAELSIFGNDYPTHDGTGVRDYLHVLDLAEGHLAALDALDRVAPGTVLTVNLGTGRGYSVLELVETFERVNGITIPRKIVARRAGDVATCYADASLAKTLLGWRAKRGIEDMCRDAWNWQRMNPNGYR
ncbi:MAG TPA: UDP-glucose 4-epimerase GalE [Usitatibacter sp.]|nr:UDP-glucose 4-epimerase GalE [Usitatibacter sp.]